MSPPAPGPTLRPTTITLTAIATLVVLTVGLGLALIEATDDDEPLSTGAPVPPTSVETPDVRAPGPPASGQLRVEGLLGGLELEARFAGPIPTPVTFVPASRGSGNSGELRGVIVGEGLADIIWDGGRDLVVEGTGGFAFDRVPIVLEAGVLRAQLGEVVGDVAPGDYIVRTPVAVGASGLAEPRDEVAFVVGATEASKVAFRGEVSVTLGPSPPLLLGPGAGTLTGTFGITRPDGSTQDASTVTIGPDTAFEIEVAAVEGGWLVNALLEGDVTVA